MHADVLNFLRCPLSGNELKCTIYDIKGNNEIVTGILTSPTGFVFPIINGIPRFQIEGILIFGEFFTKYLAGYTDLKKQLLTSHGKLIKQRFKANKATRKSFSFEWNLLKRGSTKVWHNDSEAQKTTVLNETAETVEWFNGKKIVDIGCGHGLTSEIFASMGALVIAMDMSSSIEEAYKQRKYTNLHYIQADLQYPPLAKGTFDLVFSSGVIHHTHNTQYSFAIIQKLTKPTGKICLWLYHPVKSVIHNSMLAMRPVTKRMPLSVLFWLLFITLLPVYKIVVFVKGKKVGWREIMIDFIDILTPRYRYEHTYNEVCTWIDSAGFAQARQTTTNLFGFSVTAIKQAD